MLKKKFRAFEVQKISSNSYRGSIVNKSISQLPEGDLLIKVLYSSLNYKDALSAAGNKGVTRDYPHTPGIDAAGIVTETNTDKYSVGDRVVVTGYDLGMNTAGGFGEFIRIPEKWAVKCPENLSLRESMIYGTAGFTAALSVKKIIDSGVKVDDGQVLVTGGTGGVGSIAISILSKLGYEVIASTGKLQARDFLIHMGAKDIITREELHEESRRPLLKGRWSAVVDAVGGMSLTNALKGVQYGGCVTCCGNVAAHDFNSSIYPFILRGVSLFGIDSVQCPAIIREDLWEKLATSWKIDSLDVNTREVTLDQVDERLKLMLEGKHVGRAILIHHA
jgi:putative YhdH/YhfP family quinone oxidoreductase